jgi:hypothetical protein
MIRQEAESAVALLRRPAGCLESSTVSKQDVACHLLRQQATGAPRRQQGFSQARRVWYHQLMAVAIT